MKYFSINHISDFEFHDSYWELLSYDSSILVLNARNLNIHKDALQNSDMCDMEIGSAVIAFDKFKLISHNPTEGIEEPNASEKACISDVTETSIKAFLHEIRNGITVYHFNENGIGLFQLQAGGEDPFFETVFSADTIRIEWDDVIQPAWYVHS